MKRFLKILLSLNSLRKALGFSLFFKSIKNNYHLDIVKDLNFQRVLVLAPHPDDDIFGCGGTLSILSQQNAHITVIYFCDGSGGVEENQIIKSEKSLIGIRKDEARQAARIVGIQSQSFFGYPDGKLASGSSAVQGLIRLIKETKPDIIFVPSFIDNHPDHREVNQIFVNALSEGNINSNFQVWAYEIWTPIWPNKIIEINKTLEQKKQAINAHKSQIQARSYDKAILALNQYRAEINNLSGYAEAYFASSVEIYKDLYRKS